MGAGGGSKKIRSSDELLFLFELSLELGYAHPRLLLEDLTSQDVTDWIEVYKLRPFGFVRNSHLFGVLASLLYNPNRAEGKRPLDWQDFFPVAIEQAFASEEHLLAVVKEYNQIHAATFAEQSRRRGPKRWKLKRKQG